MSKQISLWRATDTPSTITTEYCSPMGNGATFGTEAAQSMVAAAAGIFRNLRVVTSAAPGSGNSWTVTLRVNGSGSALTVTISGTDTDEELTGVDINVAAGDVIALEFVPVSGPTSMTPSVSLEFDSTTAGASMYGSGSSLAISATRNNPLFGGNTSANWTEEASINAVEGDLTALYVSLDGAPGTGSYTFAIEKNGTLQDGSGGTVDTRVTIATAATTGNASFTLSCSPGDLFRIRATPATPGTARRPRYGVRLIADTPGVSNYAAAPNDVLNASATEYFSPMSDGSGAFTATESARQATAGVGFSLLHLQFGVNLSPGSTRAYQLALRINGSTTALAASVADLATSGSASATVTIVPGDLVSVQSVPTNNPTVRTPRWAFSQQVITARPRSFGAIF